ncbi:sugar transferase [Nocardioides dokdonensis]|uniref:sugar transferase n=1 Tax=Nocardioides dokdonensis TaxID=450734 RepID=UPI00082C16DB|nr:sugar transferase [Nocardioides dokdonensis]
MQQSIHARSGLSGIGPILVVSDLAAVLATGFWIDRGLWPVALGSAALALALVARSLGLYQSRLVLSVLEDLPALLVAITTGGLLVLGLGLEPSAPRGDALVRAGTFTAALAVVLVGARAVGYALLRAGRRRGALMHRVLIVGTDGMGIRLARALQSDPATGLSPVGFVDDDADPRTLPAPLLGDLRSLPRVMRDLNIHDVVFAWGARTDDQTIALVRHCQEQQYQVFVIPRFFEVMGLDRARRVEVVSDVSLVRLRRWAVRPGSMFVKRAIDIAASAAALLVLAPLLAGTALAVRREVGSPIIFRQTRVGRGGRTFELLKFRSMAASREQGDTTWNIDTSDRLGSVGRFIRRTGIDELPQLWNILRGDMSLVGPRPERPHFVEQFSEDTPGYRHRHRMRTGLTGWAQVNDLRGDTAIDDRARADNYYITNWSLWGDVKIVMRTVRTVARREPRKQGELMDLVVEAGTPPDSARAG